MCGYGCRGKHRPGVRTITGHYGHGASKTKKWRRPFPRKGPLPLTGRDLPLVIAVHLEVHLGALRQAIPHLNQLHEVLPDSEVGRLAGLRQGGLPLGLRTQQRTAQGQVAAGSAPCCRSMILYGMPAAGPMFHMLKKLQGICSTSHLNASLMPSVGKASAEGRISNSWRRRKIDDPVQTSSTL